MIATILCLVYSVGIELDYDASWRKALPVALEMCHSSSAE